MVYDGSNLWANTQHTCQPWRMSWHLADDRLWTPFFGRSFPTVPLSTLQLPVRSGLAPDGAACCHQCRWPSVNGQAASQCQVQGAQCMVAPKAQHRVRWWAQLEAVKLEAEVSPAPVHKAGKLSWCWDL